MSARVSAETVYAAAMLGAWRTTKDFLRDRLLTSGRSDVNINAVLRVMNEALNDPNVSLAASPPPGPAIDVEHSCANRDESLDQAYRKGFADGLAAAEYERTHGDPE